jgi:hypothetical protein
LRTPQLIVRFPVAALYLAEYGWRQTVKIEGFTAGMNINDDIG